MGAIKTYRITAQANRQGHPGGRRLYVEAGSIPSDGRMTDGALALLLTAVGYILEKNVQLKYESKYHRAAATGLSATSTTCFPGVLRSEIAAI